MNERPWKPWIQDNIDKVILLIMFWTLLGFVIYTMGMNMEEGAVDWARSSTDLVIGALLGLITGKYLRIPTVEPTHQPVPPPPAPPPLPPT